MCACVFHDIDLGSHILAKDHGKLMELDKDSHKSVLVSKIREISPFSES